MTVWRRCGAAEGGAALVELVGGSEVSLVEPDPAVRAAGPLFVPSCGQPPNRSPGNGRAVEAGFTGAALRLASWAVSVSICLRIAWFYKVFELNNF